MTEALRKPAPPPSSPESELESVACPLCGSDDADPTPYARNPFRVVRCANCRLWYLSPRLTAKATDALYRSDDYFSGGAAGYEDYASQQQSLRSTFRRLLDELAAIGATGGRLLEVGSGPGYFLDEARPHFSYRCGIELSSKTAHAAASLSGAAVLPTLETLAGDARFDCIVALQVIEHIHEPAAFARRLGKHLAPGGVLVLATPDMGSLWRRTMGRYWPSFKYPEHVTFFDAATLARLFGELGFDRPRRLPYLHDFPLSEILAKLRLPAPRLSQRLVVPLPATTICYAARRSSDRS